MSVTPETPVRVETKSVLKRRGRSYVSVRRASRAVTVWFDGAYEVYALEQRVFGELSFSARLIAPPDRITPYRWIKAWVTCDTWAEAVIAADLLAERFEQELPLGEYEFKRDGAP